MPCGRNYVSVFEQNSYSKNKTSPMEKWSKSKLTNEKFEFRNFIEPFRKKNRRLHSSITISLSKCNHNQSHSIELHQFIQDLTNHEWLQCWLFVIRIVLIVSLFSSSSLALLPLLRLRLPPPLPLWSTASRHSPSSFYNRLVPPVWLSINQPFSSIDIWTS